jgi:hypothetical protein
MELIYILYMDGMYVGRRVYIALGRFITGRIVINVSSPETLCKDG